MQSFVTTLCNFCRRNFCVEIYFIMEYSIGSNVKKKEESRRFEWSFKYIFLLNFFFSLFKKKYDFVFPIKIKFSSTWFLSNIYEYDISLLHWIL